MTQLDPLADALAATTLTTPHAADVPATQQPSLNPAKASFASALRSGPSTAPASPSKQVSASLPATPPTPSDLPSASAVPTQEQAPVDDTLLQAMRKRDDRIFFSQYENQMAAFVRDSSRTQLELGAMNAYQRLLIHRCADQFHLDHQLDRATQSITLSKTPATSQPSALLSMRAREYLLHRDGVDPVQPHPNVAHHNNAAAPAHAILASASPSASTSTSSSPAPTPAAVLSSASGTPKAGFKIMRRDPSSSRQSRLRSADNDVSGSNSDSDKAAAKARKDMTLEEREASYKAARARIFGDLATTTTSSTSASSSTSQLDPAKDAVDSANETAAAGRDAKSSPLSSAASSPVASIAGGRSGSKKNVASSASSVASQDGSSSQRTRGNGSRAKGALSYASDSTNDDLEFSRALPLASHSPFGGAPQQSSPLALPGHVAHGYFPPSHPSHLQQSHSNPNLRSRAPVFHPQGGSSTPAYAQGGALRYPDTGAPVQGQPSWPQPGETSVNDAFPALSSTAAPSAHQNGVNAGRQMQPHHHGARNAAGGAWNRTQAAQEPFTNGVGAWAQQTSTYNHTHAAPRHQHQPQPYPQYTPYPPQQGGFQSGVMNPYQVGHPSLAPHYTQLGHGAYAGPRSATSSRASSQRGGGGAGGNVHNGSGRAARDDAVSVASISSTSSSRSASFSGVSATGSTQAQAPALSHPSLPARPAWLAPNNAE